MAIKLFEYRETTVQTYLAPYIDLLPAAECCSDTELDPDEAVQRSIRPEWRSTRYGDWLHKVDGISYKEQSTVKGRTNPSRRFDTRRQQGSTINPRAKVCANLPEACYDPAFLQRYSAFELSTLGILSNSEHLDEAILAVEAVKI